MNVFWDTLWMMDIYLYVFVPAGWPDCSLCVATCCVSRTPSSSFQISTLRRREYLKQREQRAPSRLFALRRSSQYWQKTPCTSVSEHHRHRVQKVRNWILIVFSLVLKSLVLRVRKCKWLRMCQTYWSCLLTRTLETASSKDRRVHRFKLPFFFEIHLKNLQKNRAAPLRPIALQRPSQWQHHQILRARTLKKSQGTVQYSLSQ